ncbi:MAG: OsmC family protein [Pyrinomonadaceae bacterium]|nr:OsmC family protein [Pyrinomonadaceae bacterium]
MRVHKYNAKCVWKGTTSAGYEEYDRRHEASAAPALESLSLSSDPAFRGDSECLNPEQLLVIAASSCQLLSFLAVASRARIEVLEYQDDAEAEMPEDDLPVRITSIKLKPRIVVSGEVSERRVRHLVEVAHNECYIANSLKSSIVVEPVIEVRATNA